jgi:hypothetical protein
MLNQKWGWVLRLTAQHVSVRTSSDTMFAPVWFYFLHFYFFFLQTKTQIVANMVSETGITRYHL